MSRPRSDIEPRIVHAARRRFVAEGVDGASLRNIARDAETSIGMIYYYFPTKDDLFLGVVEEVYGELLADLEQALGPDAPTAERIRRMSVRMSRLSEPEFEVVRLMLREALVSSSRLERLVERFQRGHMAIVLRTMLEGISHGEVDTRFHPLILMMAAFALCGAPHLFRHLVGERGPFTDVPAGEALANQLVDILFSGIGKKAEGRS